MSSVSVPGEVSSAASAAGSGRRTTKKLPAGQVRRSALAGAIGGLGALIANVIIWGATRAAIGGDLTVTENGVAEPVLVSHVVFSTVVGAAVGVIIALLLTRVLLRPRPVFLVLAILAGVATINPFFVATSTGVGVGLYLMHIATAAIAGGLLYRSLPR